MLFCTKNRTFFRGLAMLLAVLTLLSFAAGCVKDQPPALEENQIALDWHLGMVTSDIHQKKETLLDGTDLYSYSDIIHLKNPGTKLVFTDDNADGTDGRAAGNTVYILSHWVEVDGTFVLDQSGDHYEGQSNRKPSIETGENGAVTYTYVSTFADEYVRLCYRSGQTADSGKDFTHAKVFLTETDEAGTLTLNADRYSAVKLDRYLAASKENAWYDNLKGLTVYCLGDSYFDDPAVKDRMWVDLLEKKYDMKLSNFGASGSTVSNCPGTQSMNGMQPYQPKTLDPMCLRIENKMPADGDPDIILFDGGRNDFTKEVPLGELDSMDEATFRGAINSCIAKLKERYPNALIIGITCWNVDRTRLCDMVTQQEFGAAMKEQCAYNGIPCLDQIDETITGVHMNDGAFREQYCKTPTDISHLNEDGQMYYMPVPEKFIAEAYAAFKSGK